MVILISLVFFIRSPWGQGIVVEKATSFVSQKTNTKIEIERLFLTFGGNLSLEGLYVEDMQSDTLLYSKDLEVGIGLWDFISSGDLHISKLDWDGLKARVVRKENSEKFNYDFLIDAFVSDTTNVQETQVNQAEAESEPMKISIDPISLRNFDLIYLDEKMGMDAKLLLGGLDVDIPHLDLEKLEFDIRNIELKESQISYRQTKPLEVSEEEESDSEALALVSLDNFLIKNVSLLYNDEVSNQLADVFIGDLRLEVPEFDLETQKVMVKELSLLKSKILFHDFSAPTVASESSEQTEATPFEWPNWIVDVGSINLEENSIEFKTKDVAPRQGFFNPEAMVFEELTLTLDNIYLKNEKAGFNISEFNFKESGGFELKTFTTGLKLDSKSIEIDDFRIESRNKSKCLL